MTKKLLALAALFFVAACSSSSTLGEACPAAGDTSQCDANQVCAPKDAAATLLVCSVICDKDGDCGLNEHCEGFAGNLKGCLAD